MEATRSMRVNVPDDRPKSAMRKHMQILLLRAISPPIVRRDWLRFTDNVTHFLHQREKRMHRKERTHLSHR